MLVSPRPPRRRGPSFSWPPPSSSRGLLLPLVLGLVLALLAHPVSCAPPTQLHVYNATALKYAVEQLKLIQEVVLLPGNYEFTSVVKVTRTVTIRASLSDGIVVRPNAMTYTGRLFDILDKAQVTFQGFTIQDGTGSQVPAYAPLTSPLGGGCIGAYTSSSGFTIGNSIDMRFTNMTFANCFAGSGNGGAIMMHASFYSTLIVESCVFINNSAPNGNGGAIYQAIVATSTNGDLALYQDSQFTSNSALNGGAIYVKSPFVEENIVGCTFSQNRAENRGGAISMEEVVQIQRSRFEHNNATTQLGAAIELVNSDCILYMDNATNTNFEDNRGLDGPVFLGVIIAPSSGQIFVVQFTPNPTAKPTTRTPTTLAPTPYYAPPTLPAPQPPPASSEVTGIATGLTVSILLVMAISGLVLYRRKLAGLMRDQELAEREHADFAMRRKQRPKVVLFKEVLPPDLFADVPDEEKCVVCNASAPEASVVSRVVGTISATKNGLFTPLELSRAYCKLDCDHTFHCACMISWIEVYGNDECPICRTKVATDDDRRNSSRSSSRGDIMMAPAPAAVANQRRSSSRRSLGSFFRRASSASNVLEATGSQRSRSLAATAAAAAASTEGTMAVGQGNMTRRSHQMDDALAENVILVAELAAANASNPARPASPSKKKHSVTATNPSQALVPVALDVVDDDVEAQPRSAYPTAPRASTQPPLSHKDSSSTTATSTPTSHKR